MTSEDAAALAAVIAAVLEDSAYGISTGDDRDLTARLVADRLGPALQQLGWMPPGTHDRIRDWGRRTGEIPEYQLTPQVLNSHLCELWGIP